MVLPESDLYINKLLIHAIHVCAPHQSPNIYEANIDKFKGRNRQDSSTVMATSILKFQ